MTNDVTPDEIKSIEDRLTQELITNDLFVLDDISKIPYFDRPIKIDYAVGVICLEGSVEGSINLKVYKYSKNDFFIMLPGQIAQYSYKSPDFKGLFIIVSKNFIDNFDLNAKESVPVFFYLKESPIMHLNSDDMNLMHEYYSLLKRVLRMENTIPRMKIVRLLAQAFFYGLYDAQQSQQKTNDDKPKQEVLFDAFFNLILQHYKDSREVRFYADKLYLTPKYLSTVVKQLTGKTALEWINDYVILEAKSLLKSTNKSIQQISEELHFPSQSFFGKYFKRLVGISPKAYRNI